MSDEHVPVRLEEGHVVYFRGQKVGRYATDPQGRRVFVNWKTLHRVENAYSLTTALEAMLDDDVEFIYVIDKDRNDLFRFERDDYRNARTVTYRGDKQYALPYWQHRGYWENEANELVV